MTYVIPFRFVFAQTLSIIYPYKKNHPLLLSTILWLIWTPKGDVSASFVWSRGLIKAAQKLNIQPKPPMTKLIYFFINIVKWYTTVQRFVEKNRKIKFRCALSYNQLQSYHFIMTACYQKIMRCWSRPLQSKRNVVYQFNKLVTDIYNFFTSLKEKFT